MQTVQQSQLSLVSSSFVVIINSLSLGLVHGYNASFQSCFLILYPLSQPNCTTDLSNTPCGFQTRSLHSPCSTSSGVSFTQPLPSSPLEILPIFQVSLIRYVIHSNSDLCLSYLVWALITLFLLITLIIFTTAFPSTVNSLTIRTFFFFWLGTSPNSMPIRGHKIFAESKTIANS